jgi:hypothetical protein
MPTYMFRAPDGREHTVAARDEEFARRWVASQIFHPAPDDCGATGMTPEQAAEAQARFDQAAADLTLVRTGRRSAH